MLNLSKVSKVNKFSKLSDHPTENKIIVALDFENLDEAKKLVKQLDPNLCRLKVGKQMFTLFGPQWVRELVELDFDVFLDLKFHDIPNTVAKACAAAAKLGVWMVNVHASGGGEMMQAAMNSVLSFGEKRPLLTAVTILTSMNSAEYANLGFTRNIDDQVLHLAAMAKQSGLDGVVCSAKEAKRLSSHLGEAFKLVTPGIRPPGSDKGDQSRIMTPKQAIQEGASYLVIGRPITKAPDPLKVLCEISESLAFN